MGVSSIGSSGFASYTTPLNGGPTVAQPKQQADQTQQAQAADRAQADQQKSSDAQAVNAAQSGGSQAGGGYTTPTRGQNLNISV